MKKWLMILIILFYVGFVLSEDLDVYYPDSVNVDEEFDVSVGLVDFAEGNYDVKLEILNGSTNIGERFWDGEWKSTNFWLENAIENETNNVFRLRVVDEYDGENNITIKLRDVDGNVQEFIYVIVIEGSVDSGLYFELNWNDDNIVNGKDFKIKVEGFNLEDEKYDVRLWIEDRDDIISDRYDYENEEWKSGRYYINEMFEGPGNVSEKIKIRIDEEFDDFIGDAELFFKIRDGEEIREDIDVLKKSDVKEAEEKIVVEKKQDEKVDEIVIEEIISLGSKIETVETEDINTNKVLYESSNLGMVRYSVYGFTLLCVLLCVLVMWRKLE